MSSRDVQRGLGKVMDRALAGTATIVTRYGRPVAVIVSYELYEEWQRWKQEQQAEG